MFEQRKHEGVTYFVFKELEDQGVAHVIGTRQGGVSPPPFDTLNVSLAVEDTPERVRENRARLARILHLTPDDLVRVHLVHGAQAEKVGREHKGSMIRHRDALMTDEPGVPLFMTFADCIPVIIFDPIHRAVALVHAGWRGTAAGITMRTIAQMQQTYGSRPEDLVVALGPGIGRCHYEVGMDVIEAFDVFGRGPVVFEKKGRRYFLDLVETNAQQAAMMHVPTVLKSGYCTACHPDLFFSHRGEKGKTGRFGVIVMLGEPQP